MNGRNSLRAVIVAALAWIAMSGGAALAHTSLTESAPADGAALEASPEEIVLTFSEPVRLTALSLERGGPAVPLDSPPSERSERFAVATPELPAGEYVVSWRVISADTHVVSGELSFTVTGGHAAH
jgi:methionine-rich copper-binding protein CopC